MMYPPSPGGWVPVIVLFEIVAELPAVVSPFIVLLEMLHESPTVTLPVMTSLRKVDELPTPMLPEIMSFEIKEFEPRLIEPVNWLFINWRGIVPVTSAFSTVCLKIELLPQRVAKRYVSTVNLDFIRAVADCLEGAVDVQEIIV